MKEESCIRMMNGGKEWIIVKGVIRDAKRNLVVAFSTT